MQFLGSRLSAKSDQPIIAKILKLLLEQKAPVRMRKLVRLLGLPIESKRRIRRLVQGLVREGRVSAEGRGRYAVIGEPHRIKGTLVRKGRAFVLKPTENSETVLLSVHPDDRAGALPGDTVLAVAKLGQFKGTPSGRIVEILQRGHKPVLGIVQKGPRRCRIVPEDPQLNQSYYLDKDVSADLGDGMLVAVSIPEDSEGGRRQAQLVKILGAPGDLHTELERIILEYGLNDSHPVDVEREMSEKTALVDRVARKDLRKLPLVTIDPDDAKDFDDAVCAEKTSSGYRLWVSIADVSSYVKPAGAVDREACHRGLSVYFPAGVFPMLPSGLSEYACTLAPGRIRRAMTVELELHPDGAVRSANVYRSLMKSARRLTYREVQQALDGKPSRKTRPIQSHLLLMAECAGLLMERINARGALDLDIPEQEIRLNDKQLPVEVRPKQRLFAHRLIEAFMITANEAIANLLQLSNTPCIYRVHPPPEADKVTAFIQMARALGIDFKDGVDNDSLKKLSDYLKGIKDGRKNQIVHQLLLRSLMQARYDADPAGHYGLASDAYLHFTSPIRRYPDLVVHRQVASILEAHPQGGVSVFEKPRVSNWCYNHEQLENIAVWCTQAERRAQEAERAAGRLYQAAYMQEHLGEVFNAAVSFVTEFGLFVQILPFGIEGLVHISRMTDDYYRYIPDRIMLVGRRTGKIYRVGDALKIRIESIELSRGEIDLGLIS